MKFLTSAAMALALTVTAGAAAAACDPGEIVIKFSHVTNSDKHPKGIAATLFAERVNTEMNGKACMEVFPNSTLYTDEQVIEAMLRGDVQMAAPSLSLFESITKAYRLFDLPAGASAGLQHLRRRPRLARRHTASSRNGFQGKRDEVQRCV